MSIGISLLLAIVHLFVICGSVNVFHRKEIDTNLINGYVHRIIDLSSQISNINTTIHMQNTGESAILGFLFAIDYQHYEQLSYMSAHSEKFVRYRLKIDNIKIEQFQDTFFKYITFTEALLPGDMVSVHVETVFLHRLVPHPRYIEKSESQFVKFYDNYFFYSPYFTLIQRTVVNLPSSKILKYTRHEPAIKSGNVCKFGPYYNISAFTTNALMFYVEYNEPILTITRLQRTITVSHWGILHVEDQVTFENRGAIDSLHENQRYPAREMHPIVATIPKEARNIKYYDKLGNITTSKVNYHNTSIQLFLWPRVIEQSWTNYCVSYVLPAEDFLYNLESDFVLKMKFIDQVFPNMSICEAEVRIVLPEGSSEVMFFVPFSTFRLPNTVRNVFLDFLGRPTISVLGRNLVDKHVLDFELLYASDKNISILLKPFILAVLFFIMFILFIFLHRSLCDEEREKND